MKKRTRRKGKTPSGPSVDEVRKALRRMFPTKWLREQARETRLVVRERKIEAESLFWVLVLSYGVAMQRTLASLKRSYEIQTGLTLSDGSWYDRFTPELVAFLKRCVEHGIAVLSSKKPRELSERLKQFKDVLIKDSTIIRLHEKLAKHWPAARSTKRAAGVKLSTTISAVANGPKSVAIHGERTSEIKTLRIGPWIRGLILLIDLGFFKYHLFARISENRGFFVSRLKENADPLIHRVLKTHAGNALDVTEQKWSWVRERLKRETVDVEVEVSFSRRAYSGKKRKDTMTLRLVAVRNAETGEYHAYLTNIPPEKLTGEEIAALYGMRWEIEIVFKELKSRYALDQIKTTNPQVVEALIWIAILTMLVSRRLHHLVRKSAPEGMAARFTQLRWATVFVENAGRLLTAILNIRSITESFRLFNAVYSSGALNPHISRPAFTAECWS